MVAAEEDEWYELVGIDDVETFGEYTCPFCGVSAQILERQVAYLNIMGTACRTNMLKCAACLEIGVYTAQRGRDFATGKFTRDVWTRRVNPREGRLVKKFSNTPKKYLKPYTAACRTVTVSPEASATMARRCLEMLLSDRGYVQGRLVKKIEAVLAETDPRKYLPMDLHSCVDVIRNFGNFGAHPMSDDATLQIIDVEDGEADWCIEILEQLFAHYFERPALIAQKVAATNAKLNASGRPPIIT